MSVQTGAEAAKSLVPSPRARARFTPIAAILLLTGFLSLAVVTVAGVLNSPDRSADDSIHRFALENPGLVSVTKVFTDLGSPVATIVIGAAIAALFLWRRRYLRATFCVVAMAGSYALASLVKYLVDRRRPSFAQVLATGNGPSFPSGHSTGSASLAAVVAIAAVPLLTSTLLRSLAWALLALYALAIPLSRLLLGVHYPTDVLAGVLLGVGWALLAAAVVRQSARVHAVVGQYTRRRAAS